MRNYEEFFKNKRCVIDFNINDKLCLLRAILIAKENAPSNFSRIMYMVLGHITFVQIYLDDITVHSKSFSEHMDHLRQVCLLLKKAGLSLNLKKCNFCAKEIKLLGHKISYGKVLMDPKKISALKDRKPPTCVRIFRYF